MLVSFVQAQLMTFAQSLGIILGADIGTTITAQLIAFKLTDYALIVIGIGFGMMFLFKSKKLKNIGEAILGFGLLFFGMWIMSDAMAPLRTYEPFINILLQLENPLLGILVGTAFTALIQSSSAFTGIIIVLGSQGLITLEAAIPLLFGANIGTSITAALASINTGREAKRVALAHTLFKVLGVLLFVWWIPSYAEIIRMISPDGAEGLSGAAQLADVVPRQIANAHTIFNVALTIIFLPFTVQAAAFIYKLLPDKAEPEEEGEFKTKYLEDSLVSTPT
jgi:phosphate:Na+ symporter